MQLKKPRLTNVGEFAQDWEKFQNGLEARLAAVGCVPPVRRPRFTKLMTLLLGVQTEQTHRQADRQVSVHPTRGIFT